MILNANALNIPLVDGCVQCVVTSPPYYGLRDYGTALWEGGVGNCDHKVGRFTRVCNDKQLSNKGSGQAKNVCPKCGAVRIDNQIGLESDPEEYVQKLVIVFREVRRVLKDDGCVFLNLGDTYNGSGGAGGDYNNGGEGQPKYSAKNANKSHDKTRKIFNLKPKDLIGIPWMVAFALRNDGWYLRSDIIWAKNNAIPEPVKDRPTRSHEYIFLLSKSRYYYYDYEAIQEDAKHTTETNIRFGGNKGEFVDNPTYSGRTYTGNGKRNKRDVWTVNTAKFPDAHYATFPEKLIEPCILAGCPQGGMVLDPFFGAGTTALVAIKNMRKFVGLELNLNYINMARKRIYGITPKMM